MGADRSPRAGPAQRGLFLVVAGPDGAGKTTIVEQLVADARVDRPVLRLHHRPRVLGGLTSHDGPVTEPHRDAPYPRLLSAAKLLYLYLDHLVGWWVRLRPHLRRGGDVVLERGWWDLLVDPLRYRLRSHPRLARLLGRLLPRPAATIVLVAEPAVLARRTTELAPAELARQVAAWRQVPPRTAQVRFVDVGQELPAVLEEVRSAVLDARYTGGWTGLPNPRRPRWVVPRRPRRAARNALLVYTPVTPHGVVGWNIGRVLTRLGINRLLPPTTPPRDVLERVSDLIPAGGSVAVGHGSHRGCVALVLDRRGDPTLLAKLSEDAAGAAELAAEADAATWVPGRLTAPLDAPHLLAAARDRLCFETVHWSPRARPWVLPPEVADALGRFYATSGTPGSGPSHGDCAPWNLLRGRDGWYLIDWSEATRDAPPFTDPIHYVVQAHALLGRPSRGAVLAGLEGKGWVGDALEAYCHAAGLALTLARPALTSYLDATIPRMDTTASDGRRGLAARHALRRALR